MLTEIKGTTHLLWKTIHGLSNRAAPTTHNCAITFNKKIATSPQNIVNCFNKHTPQTCATYTQVLSLSTSLQGTTTKYCAHTHRKSAALKRTYPGTRVVP